MATLAVYTKDNTHADSEKDQRGCWKRGMVHEIYEDGVCVEPPSVNTPFVFFHIPGVPRARVLKYALAHLDQTDVAVGVRVPAVIRRRRWRVRWEDLPTLVRNRIISQRQITIAAGGYAGARDYTWAQVRDFFRNLETGTDETDNLS